jgi:hypothetical protein
MRHVAALLVAILIAPSSWLLLAFGQDRSARAFTEPLAAGAFNTTDFVRPAAYLAAAGLLLGLLATLRYSPLALTLTGAGYTAGYLALLVAPTRTLGLFPHSVTVAARSADPTTPLRTGTALVLGTSMLVAAISVKWRQQRPPAQEPEQLAATEPAQQRLPGARGSGPSPSTPAAESGAATRHGRKPLNAGNRRPNSYRPANNNSDRWQRTRQATWRYQ